MGGFEAWRGKTLSVPLDAESLRFGRGERSRPDPFRVWFTVLRSVLGRDR